MKTILIFIFILLAYIGPAQGQTPVDLFGELKDEDVYARIDHFGSVISKNPGSLGHAVVVKPTGMPLGQFLRYFYGIRNVWAMHGYTNERLLLYADEKNGPMSNEFWITPPGKWLEPPTFSITSSLAKPIPKKTLFDMGCVGCDPSVQLKQLIFAEGLDYFGKALTANPTSTAEILVGRNESVSETRKEQSKLRQKIYEVLTQKYKIPTSRIKIRFGKSMYAYLYIVPTSKVSGRPSK